MSRAHAHPLLVRSTLYHALRYPVLAPPRPAAAEEEKALAEVTEDVARRPP